MNKTYTTSLGCLSLLVSTTIPIREQREISWLCCFRRSEFDQPWSVSHVTHVTHVLVWVFGKWHQPSLTMLTLLSKTDINTIRKTNISTNSSEYFNSAHANNVIIVHNRTDQSIVLTFAPWTRRWRCFTTAMTMNSTARSPTWGVGCGERRGSSQGAAARNQLLGKCYEAPLEVWQFKNRRIDTE